MVALRCFISRAKDCGLVQHRGSGFRDKLQSIAAEEAEGDAEGDAEGRCTTEGTVRHHNDRVRTNKYMGQNQGAGDMSRRTPTPFPRC